MKTPKCFKPDPKKLALEVARFEAIVGSGTVERIRSQTELEAFCCDLIAAVHRYHATMKSREFAALLMANDAQARLLGDIRQYMGEENYLTMLSFFGARR